MTELADDTASELRPLPPSRFGGAKDRFDDRHVADGVFDRDWNIAVAAHGSGKNITLNRVLITRGKSFRAYAATEHIAAIIYKDPAWPVVRGIEWYLDLDASFGSEELHALVRHELHAARENGLARWKIQDDGC
jgi:hypothetical protein